MDALAIKSVARDLLEAVAPLVGDSAVTVMDRDGFILASSQPCDAGAIHHGAVEAIRQRRLVRTGPTDAEALPGAKEGVCLPIVSGGEIIGAVEVRGGPAEVERTAGLLAACVGLCLDMSARGDNDRFQKSMRIALLRAATSPGTPDPEAISTRGRELGLELRLPARIIVVTPVNGGSRTDSARTLARFEEIVASEQRLDPASDLVETLDGSLVLLKHAPETFDTGAFAGALHAALSGGTDGEVGIGIGRRCDSPDLLPVSRHEAAVLSELGGGVRSIDDPVGRMYYMLRGSLDFGASARYLALLEADLKKGIGGKDYRQVMRTVRAYCDADCHGGRAAENLGVHKNTMNYRMNKIVSLLGLDGENAFVREFFLRLLVLRGNDGAMAEE